MILISLIILNYVFVYGKDASSSKIDSLERLIQTTSKSEDLLKIYSELSNLTIAKKDKKSIEYSHRFRYYANTIRNKQKMANAVFNLGKAHNELQNFDSALVYLNEALLLLEEVNDNKKLSEAYNLIGVIHYNRSNYSEALTYYQKGLEIRKELKDEQLIAQSYNNIALVYENIGDYPKALELHQKSIEIKMKANDKKGLSASYVNIGRIHITINNLGLAKEYYEKALKLKIELQDEAGKAFVLNNIGKIYELEKKYDTALFYYTQSLEIKKKLNDKRSIANTLNNIGNIFLSQDDNNSALGYYNQALSIYQEVKDEKSIAQTFLNIAKVHYKSKNLDKTLLFADSSLRIASENNFYLIASELYDLLAQVYADKRDFKNAYKFSRLFISSKDSIQALEQSRHIAEMEVKFKTKAIEKEMELLLQQREKTKNVVVFLVVISVLFLILIAYIYLSYRMKSKINAELVQTQASLEESNATKDKFFSIIAHDLKNPLSAFKNTITILKENFDYFTDEEKKDMIAEMEQSSQKLLQLLENILNWSRSQTGKIQIHPENFDLHYLVNNVISLSEIQSQEKSITIENRIPENTYIFSDPNLLLTVIRNILSNAIKFTQRGGNIIVDLEIKDKILIKISDNGIGMAEEVLNNLFSLNKNISLPGTNSEKGTGLGLILCKEFVEKLGGRIWVESKLNVGTTVFIELPLSMSKIN